jgi:DUF4097 and DUF4098 domain-containing protein YvlB
MTSKTFHLGENPRLLFRSCSGRIRIQGREGENIELLFGSSAGALDVKELKESLEITASGPLTAHVPSGATVTVESCTGELRATSFNALHLRKHLGDINLKNVAAIEMTTLHGDVRIQGAQSLQVMTLYGDLRAESIVGKLHIMGIHGDISLRQTSGQMDLQNITGDLSLGAPDGQLDVHDMVGDLRVQGDLQSGEYRLETCGDVVLRLAPTSNARLELAAPMGSVASHLELGELQESAHEIKGSLGEGTAKIQVTSCNGDIAVRQLRDSGSQYEIREERARKRAQRQAEKARRRAERLARKAREKQARWLERGRTKGYASQKGVSSKDQDNERLAVLSMLSEGKINAEQAQALLDALES